MEGWDVGSKATFPVANWEKEGIGAAEKEGYGNSENNRNWMTGINKLPLNQRPTLHSRMFFFPPVAGRGICSSIV